MNLRKEAKRLTVQPITEYTLLVRMEAGLSIICTLSVSRKGSIGPWCHVQHSNEWRLFIFMSGTFLCELL